MNRRAALIVAAIAATAALGWLATRIERKTETERIGYSGEARRNPFLAAQRLAPRMGYSAREVATASGLDQLSPATILVLPNRRQALAPVQRSRVLAWVARGGHLVIEAEYLALSDPWLDALGVGRERAERVSQKELPVSLPPESAPLTVSGLGREMRLVTPEPVVTARVETARGLQLVQLRHGRGLVTVAASLDFARNSLIGIADNAEFFWRIVTTLPASRELGVFNRLERLSLWGWLTANALAVVLAGGALLLLWLWRAGPRFGPVAADAPPSRRRLLDHLRAAGRFHWMNDGRERLVEAAREMCLARLTRAHPGYASAPSAERAARLAEYVGVSEAEAARLVTPGPVAGGAEFIALMRAFQQVHARLDRGA